ncbi:MAG: D-alanyl-D-alanine carboxypeptidase [Christensenellaceae bacterium]|jgi:D-alanyl-D-alanine carboxypeptidase (penicillin-binding protein 5/6)|nr:D-alanyl-D-alanine carboxypeptidase [Christensenellaceae bacterium]
MIKKILVIGLTTVAAASALLTVKPCCKHCNSVNATIAPIAQVMAKEKTSMEVNVTAKAAFLVETNSGKVLYTKDENKRLPIASMVKITTLAVIYDALEAGQIKMDQKVMVSREASGMGGSQAFLDFDSEYTVEDLIKSIIIASANDSCVAMAELIAGSESDFVTKMNELATKLGMENTNYVNCTGLPAAGGYSCATDVAKVYQHLMRSPYYAYKSGDTAINLTWMYDLTHPSGRVTGLTNTNKHARFFNGCIGGKTGFTAEAGHCVTVAAERGAMKPLAVIIGAADSTTRFAESGNLLNHVFGGYENKLIVDRTQKVGTVKVKNALNDSIDVFARENYFDLVKKGDKTAGPVVTVEFGSARAPFKRDTALGKIIVTNDGVVVREIDIVSGQDIAGLGYGGAIKKVTRNFKL